MASDRLRINRQSARGYILGLIVGIIALFIIMSMIPDHIDSLTASNFFFAATGVNATLLVAITISISSILNRTEGRIIPVRKLFMTAQLVIVFFGLIVSGVSIMIFSSTEDFDYSEFHSVVLLIFTTWVVSFALLISGIWVSVTPETSRSRN